MEGLEPEGRQDRENHPCGPRARVAIWLHAARVSSGSSRSRAKAGTLRTERDRQGRMTGSACAGPEAFDQ
jgi:hypothetical protein